MGLVILACSPRCSNGRGTAGFPVSGRLFSGLVAAVLMLLPTMASASLPQLSLILPRGVERGGDREFTFSGQRLGDAVELLFYDDAGFQVKSLTPVDEKSFKAVVHVPADCPPGEHIVQVRSKSGISEYRSFWVGILPVADEKEPNGLLEQAQEVPLGTTLHGVCKSEDLDIYAIDVKKGQRIGVEVEGLRLGSHRFDPHVSIVDAKRFELASADDSPATLQDGILSVLAPEDGRYYVQIRETSYAGDDASRYRLHIGGFPRPSAVYPAGGRAGEKTKVTFLGDAAGPLEREIDVPAQAADGGDLMRIFATDDRGTSPSGLPFRISTLANQLEQEPNNDAKSATSAEASMAFNGIIQEPGDVDCFRFGVKKGQSFEVECHSRRLRSGLDPVVNILNASGGRIAGNDDAKGPDSVLRFDVPADGEYVIEVRDHLGRGRADFTYRVEMSPITKSFVLSIPRIDRYSQTRQTVFVPKGNRFGAVINVARRNFDGDLVLDGSGLPPGITMHAPTIKAGQTQVPVVFEAAADAAVAGKLLKFEARHVTPEDPEGKNGVRGHFENNADFVLGDPNNSVHYTGHVEKLAVAVIEPLPFHVEIVQPKAPLVKRGKMELKVLIKRAEGFTQPVTVELPYRPAGVGTVPSMKIEGDKSEAVFQINADAKAAVGTWPIFALASADVGGTAWAASQMASLEVAEPFTEATLVRSACEQGKPTQIICKLTQVRPFEGEAVARLQALPTEAAAAELKFTKDTKELVFDVTTTDKTPVGNHKSVFVEILTPVAGEPVQMSGGSTELQVAAASAPKPAAATPAAPQPAAAAQAAAPAKPLSRLEKLRQEKAAVAGKQ
jgi:hypothetical protein